MALIKKLTKIGNSYGVILPNEIISLLGIEIDDDIELTVEKNGLLIHPKKKENDLVMDSFNKFINQYDDTLQKLAR